MTKAKKDSDNTGWWWKFVALLFGAPPIAVWAAEDEVEAERAKADAESDVSA